MGSDAGASEVMTSATFATRFKQARAAAGLSLSGMAIRADTSRRAVSIWEEGGATPRIDTVERLAEALGVAACWLAYGCEKCSPVSGAPLKDTAALSR